MNTCDKRELVQGKIKYPIDNLTDDQVLKEFVKRFKCDGAILIYLEDNQVQCFGRWRNATGKSWIKNFWKTIKQEKP